MNDLPKADGLMETREDRRRGRSEAIKRLLSEYAACDDEDLLFQMVVTICRLSADGADRGDLKILNTALRELRYAFKVFAPYADVPKVSIFGSSRTSEDHPQYLQARKFAELVQQAGWMVITGAGDGIMRAGHHGASRKASFGVAISLPGEQATNTIIADDPKLVNFNYFFTRKLVFVKEAKAIVLFPGGFGTQDEGFESLTLVQTLKAVPVPIVLCDEPGGTYWQHWQAFVESELLAAGMIDRSDLDLFFVTDSAEAAVGELLRFYRRYHSSRYVADRLVFRLNSPLSDETLCRINDTFADILLQGCFEQTGGPIRGEDGAYPDKARLVFSFDRRSAGPLRHLINTINDA
ncbi:MAG: LOG family protein [Phycisphaerae bacterium]